jgi:signal peptidase I
MKPDCPVPVRPLWQRLIVGRSLKWTLIRSATLAVTAYVVFKFVLLPVRIRGESMEPTYRDGGINFINQLAYRWSAPRRGDVVGVMLSERHTLLFKRIIALPGETIAIEKGVVMINGQPLEEPYIKARAEWQLTPRQMGPDEYMVIGDNRGVPQELHVFGAAKARKIVGRVLW